MHFVYGMREKLSEKCPIISLRSMKDGTMGYEKHKYSRTYRFYLKNGFKRIRGLYEGKFDDGCVLHEFGYEIKL